MDAHVPALKNKDRPDSDKKLKSGIKSFKSMAGECLMDGIQIIDYKKYTSSED
jgi:hypothetical protein